MNCPEAREAFSDLYDGILSGPQLADLSRHLDGCPACRAEWAAFRRTMHALNEMGDEEPSRDFAARVAERIEPPRWWQRALTVLVVPLRVKLPIHAAALVLLGLMGLWMSQRSPELQRAAVERAPAAEQRAAPALKTPPPPAPPAAPLAQAQGEVGQPGRLQSVPPPPEGRAKTEARPGTESSASVMQRSVSAPARRSADDLYSSGVTEFAAQRYGPAIDDLRAFLTQHPDDGRAPDAQFLLADAYRARGRYAEAGAEFEAFLHRYPDHRRAPVALYRQGESQLLSGDQSGCNTLRDALKRYPDAREAGSARQTLAARCP